MLKALVESTRALGQLIGALVIALVAGSLAYSTATRTMHQRGLGRAVLAFYSGSLAAKGTGGSNRKLALAELRAATVRDADDGRPYSLMAGMRLREGNLDQATIIYKKAGALAPDDFDLVLGLGASYLQLAVRDQAKKAQHLKAAKTALKQAREMSEDAEFAADVMLGAVEIMEGKSAAALKRYKGLEKKLKQIVPGREALTAYYWDRGVAELLVGDLAAYSSFRRAIQLRPDWPEASTALAGALCRALTETEDPAVLQKRLAAVEVIGRQYIRGKRKQTHRYGMTRPQVASVLNAQGMAYFQLKQFKLADETLRRALKLSRDNTTYELNLAQVIQTRAEVETDAKFKREAFREAGDVFAGIAEDSKIPGERRWMLYMNAGYNYDKGKAYGDARKQLLFCNQIDYKRAETARCLGIVYSRNSRGYKAAVKWFRRAVELGHPQSFELEARAAALSE